MDENKERRLEKMGKMAQSDKNKYIKLLLRKAWGNVVRNVIKIHRFA